MSGLRARVRPGRRGARVPIPARRRGLCRLHASAAAATRARSSAGSASIGIDRDPAALARPRRARARRPRDARPRRVRRYRSDSRATSASRKVDGFIARPRRLVAAARSSPSAGSRSRKEGPLDMRMDPTRGPTALDLLRDLERGRARRADQRARRGALRQADRAPDQGGAARGPARTRRPISRAWSRRASRSSSSASRRSTPRPARSRRCASRSTRELDQLERFLAAFPDLLAAGRPLRDHLASTRSKTGWSRTRSAISRGRRRCRRSSRAEAGERVEPVVELLTQEGGVRHRRRGRAQPARPLGAAARVPADLGAEPSRWACSPTSPYRRPGGRRRRRACIGTSDRVAEPPVDAGVELAHARLERQDLGAVAAPGRVLGLLRERHRGVGAAIRAHLRRLGLGSPSHRSRRRSSAPTTAIGTNTKPAVEDRGGRPRRARRRATVARRPISPPPS